MSNRSLGELNYHGTMGQITVEVIGMVLFSEGWIQDLEWEELVKLDGRAESEAVIEDVLDHRPLLHFDFLKLTLLSFICEKN